MKLKLILVILVFFLSGCSEIAVKENSSEVKDLTSETITTENSDVSQFNGSDFAVLPKNKKIQVFFAKHIDGDSMTRFFISA